jgi:tripartite-type tricarboxylate transporter receptor subunit TctC
MGTLGRKKTYRLRAVESAILGLARSASGVSSPAETAYHSRWFWSVRRRAPVRPTIAVAAVVSLIAAVFTSPPASAQSVEEFYKSHPVTIMVGFNVGNIYDTVMRTVARHIGKHIPGNPTVIPVNRPGAGSLAAANQVFNASPRDGTVIGVFNRSIPTEPLLGSSGAAKFDATKFTWIGNVGNEVSVCVTRRETGAKTWNDMITKTMQVAVTSTSADTGVYPLLMNNMFGAKLKLVTGYQGGADMTLALERGEVDGRCGWSLGGIKTSRPSWLKDGRVNFPVQLGLRGSPDLAGIPLIMDQAANDQQRRILKLVISRQELAYAFAAPPDLPDDRTRTLRTAFDRTMKDAEFLAEADKMAIEVSAMTGADVERLMKEIYETPADLVAEARRVISP